MAKFTLVIAIFVFSHIILCNAPCERLFANTVSVKDAAFIVKKHNNLRSLISQGRVPRQPKGKNLKTIKWDKKLESAAQNIANTCVYGHVKVTDDRFSAVGQNIFKTWTTSTADTQTPNWEVGIQAWFNEHQNFTYPSTSLGVTGHYTQIVWADTYLIGCGFSSYFSEGSNEKFYVCNYAPAGNVVGQAPYKT